MAAFSGMSVALENFSDTLSRAKQLRALFEMSDAELAARGLSRGQIVNHVYRDIKYL